MTGAVLHDIGKIYELSYERGFSYCSEGQLLGHMMIGMRMVGEKLRDIPDFPPRAAGARGAHDHQPSRAAGIRVGQSAAFPEALLLHYLDDMDSKMECMRQLIENDRQVDGCFTGYSTSLERAVLKKQKYLQGGPAGPPAPAPQPARSEPAQPDLFRKHPINNSPFASKLLQALQPAEPKLGA